MLSEPILSVSNLAVDYPGRMGREPVRVLHDVSFELAAGETVALVGESGSGKSTIGNAILGLAPVAEGVIRLRGREIQSLSPRGRRAIASDLQVIFQNPYGSLNPALTIGATLAEPLRAAGVGSVEVREIIRALLESVDLPAEAAERHPSHFSGGQRQRIAIARAVAMEPAVIVCDEPTSALDVSTQATVLKLLKKLQARLGIAYLFITHDLAVVRQFADRTLVLQQGRIVEAGKSVSVCESPQHPYTQNLVEAAPVPNPGLQRLRREERTRRMNSNNNDYLVRGSNP